MKKQLKVLTLLLALVMALASLAGCAKTPAAPAEPTAAPAVTDAPSDAKDVTPAKEEIKDSEKPTLKVLLPNSTTDYNTTYTAKYLEEATGYHVEYDMLPADNTIDKLNMILANGSDYDLILMNGEDSVRALYYTYAANGAILDLTDLLPVYAPNAVEKITEASFSYTKVNGRLYCIPNYKAGSVAAGLAVRKDWIDALGLKLPTTTAEFRAMLEAFRDNDPGKNGDLNIPFTVNGSNNSVNGIYTADLTGAFGLYNIWNEVNGSMVARAEDARLADYLTYMNGLYQDGLLDREFATNNGGAVTEKFASGRCGCAPINWSGMNDLINATKSTNPNAEVVYIPALTGESGEAGFSVVPGFDRICIIPASCENAKYVLDWINTKMTDEVYKRTMIGEEGVHHSYNAAEDAYYPLNPTFNTELSVANNYIVGYDETDKDNDGITQHTEYWGARVRKNEGTFYGYDFLNWSIDPSFKHYDILGRAPYIEAYCLNNATLVALENEFAIQVVVGNKSVSDIDAFRTEWRNAGGAESAQAILSWYASK